MKGNKQMRYIYNNGVRSIRRKMESLRMITKISTFIGVISIIVIMSSPSVMDNISSLFKGFIMMSLLIIMSLFVLVLCIKFYKFAERNLKRYRYILRTARIK